MLTAVRLQDFKNHIDTKIRLGRLTCLVGPNANSNWPCGRGLLSSMWRWQANR
jgi:predicted ATPase